MDVDLTNYIRTSYLNQVFYDKTLTFADLEGEWTYECTTEEYDDYEEEHYTKDINIHLIICIMQDKIGSYALLVLDKQVYV